MAVHPHSVVVICSDADKTGLLAIGNAMGIDGGMAVPLSATGAAPATYWGAHSWATDTFAGIMDGSIQPIIPGVTAEQISDVLGRVTVSVARDAVHNQAFSPREHFGGVLASMGLVEVAL